jgi:hypothetical protein
MERPTRIEGFKISKIRRDCVTWGILLEALPELSGGGVAYGIIAEDTRVKRFITNIVGRKTTNTPGARTAIARSNRYVFPSGDATWTTNIAAKPTAANAKNG